MYLDLPKQTLYSVNIFTFISIQIKWYKGSKELEQDKFPITHTDGVITIEIINAQPGDSGKYKCVASNKLGEDSSDCAVIVEGSQYSGGAVIAASSGNMTLLTHY